MSLENLPEWWHWELELSAHVLKRMVDRNFSEVELRRMIELATGLYEDVVPGRWVIATHHESRTWEIIVEPDPSDKVMVVITAYSKE